MSAPSTLWLMFASYGVGALACLLAFRWATAARLASHAGLLVGAGAGVALALERLLQAPGQVLVLSLPNLFPFARMTLRLDGLGAYFLLVVSVVAFASAIYGPAYLRLHAGGSAAVHALGLNAFVASMALVLCAGDALTFLLAWEGMTLASYALVVSDGSEENGQAGLVYIVMAHAGTALLLVVFLVLAERGTSLDFDVLRVAGRAAPERTRSVLFFLALAGLAAKAGVVPLHVWLPQAHPAAPSHVSALMSGVMLKVALYAVLRFGFDLLAPAGVPLPRAWGFTLLGLGTLSALFGVLYALQQHDIKRLLAFHSVENVGIILMGFGIAMLLARGPGGMATLATLGMAAGLMHTLNHAAFKGLLFLGAGSVIARTHVRNMEELGGLARRMPYTAWLFLIGSVAISALPPLNGFVSEWMTFQALVLGGGELADASGLMVVLSASMLALTGGLAAACFVKAFGVTFLGRAKSAHAERAREAPFSMILGMLLLALVCVLLGVLPGLCLRLLDAPAAILVAGDAPSALFTARGPLVLSATGSVGAGTAISTTAVAALFLAFALGAALLVIWPRRAGRRLAPTWTCGMTPESRFDYTATAFAKPLRFIFTALYRPHRQVDKDTGPNPYGLKRLHWSGDVADVAEIAIYRRFSAAVLGLAHAVRKRSTGSIHGYIGFVLVTLILVLLAFGRG